MAILGHKTEKMAKHYTHNTQELLNKEYAKMRISTPISTPIRSEKLQNH
jgi:hypothetical protein